MFSEITFSRFAHFDTNILSTLAKNEALWEPLQEFLHSHDLCLAIGSGQISELSSDDRLHEPLNDLLTAAPSALIKTHDVILDEEVKSYPYKRTDTLFQYPLNALLGKPDFGDYLSSAELTKARDEQKQTSYTWMQNLTSLKPNFPPGKSGKYTRAQAPFFANVLTFQELVSEYSSFLQQFKDNYNSINFEVFLSIRIKDFVTFYKYYLTGLEPTKASDFGDMFHLHAMPYCKLVVVERNMCEILNQIKMNSSILDGTVVKNIKFLDDWDWNEEN